MTSILKIVGVVMVVGVLCVGVVALATDFVWDGITGSDTNWTTESNWEQGSSYPQNANDNADITDGINTCTYDPESALTINMLTLAGDSPTKRKLLIKDKELTVQDFDLGDYGELDVDWTMTVNNETTMSGTVWVDVQNQQVFAGDLVIDAGQTVLNLTAPFSPGFIADTIIIDAAAAEAPRSLKLIGSILRVGVFGDFIIKGDDVNDHKAKFWLTAGSSIDVQANGSQFLVTGGSENASRAEMDLDDDVSADVSSFTGHVRVDVASNKTFNPGLIVLIGPCVFTKSGSGELVSSP